MSIASVRVGDRVLAWDEATGRTGSFPVSVTWVHDDPVTGLVIVDGEAIATTPGHPFYTVGRGWVAAGDLRVGDEVPSAAGDPGTVEAIRWDRGPDAMYDLTVAVAHTFFVGNGAWLVHNRGPKCGQLKEADEAYPKKVGREEWHHIQPRYLGGGRSSRQVRIPAPYHQRITNRFRDLAPYGRRRPNRAEVAETMRRVYRDYPIGGFPFRGGRR